MLITKSQLLTKEKGKISGYDIVVDSARIDHWMCIPMHLLIFEPESMTRI